MLRAVGQLLATHRHSQAVESISLPTPVPLIVVSQRRDLLAALHSASHKVS